MKKLQTPPAADSKKAKNFQRKSAFHQQQMQTKVSNPKLVRIVQSVTAGHIRGGHSFH